MKKKLNIDSITNELEGASLFFTKSASPLPLPDSKPEKQASATATKAHDEDEINITSLAACRRD